MSMPALFPRTTPRMTPNTTAVVAIIPAFEYQISMNRRRRIIRISYTIKLFYIRLPRVSRVQGYRRYQNAITFNTSLYIRHTYRDAHARVISTTLYFFSFSLEFQGIFHLKKNLEKILLRPFSIFEQNLL